MNQNTGAESRSGVFIVSRRLETAVLDGLRNSEGPQQNSADENERGARRQKIEFQGEVHASHLHHDCAWQKRSRIV
jgi:hypothetical protein